MEKFYSKERIKQIKRSKEEEQLMRKETEYSIPWEKIQAELFTPEEIEMSRIRVRIALRNITKLTDYWEEDNYQ